MIRILLTALALVVAAPVFAAKTAGSDVPLADFFRHAEFTSVSLSPDGQHLAVTVPEDDRTLLAVLRVGDKKLVGKWDYGTNLHIQNVLWVTNERIVFRVAYKTGSFDFRSPAPDLYASNIDGSRRIDIPNGNTYQILGRVQAEPGKLWVQRSIDQAYLFRLDTMTGRVITEAMAPLDGGGFVLDREDNIRYAVGVVNNGRTQRTLRRDGDQWTMINETESGAGGFRTPLGFLPDNKRVYFLVSDKGETSRLVAIDPETQASTVLSHNETVEPSGWVTGHDESTLLAMRYEDGFPSYDLIAPEHPLTPVLAGLIAAFPDHAVQFFNVSEDENLIVFRAYSDVDPGTFYMFNRETGQATYLLSNRQWIKPEKMARMRPIKYTARDGLEIHGYLTLPNGLEPEGLPMVLFVHGGPHGVRDGWVFDPHVQVMASRGYAVLQVNYRGSGGYGRHFMSTGYRKWGTTMQDDLTDAVKWITGEGIVDPDRVCIYGASYGGYAALMSPVREPDLYQCTIGYVGVYSLPMMFKWGDIPETPEGRAFQSRILPETEAEQRAQSAAYNVDRIRIPVMLVHGEKDQRVPIQQYNFLLRELRKAGKPPEDTVVEKKEGHGFYDVQNNVNLYTRIFRFLDRHTAP
ncbi:MAG: S9 family peptidase [Gammaproteobacteria bacterium]